FRHVRFWWLVGTSLQNFIFGEHMDFEFQISVVSFSVYLDTDLDSNLDLKVSVDYNQREFLSEELMA
ncbi:22313_t:CDS:2, partial [Rhizophagus irregularis]